MRVSGPAAAVATAGLVVAVDQGVTEPSAYVISNNQEDYAYLGAKWLFEQIGGKGEVFYMRGAAGASAATSVAHFSQCPWIAKWLKRA